MADKKTWDSTINEHIETPQKMTSFFEDIYEVCKKHGLSISHEDTGGAFKIEPYDKHNIVWLKLANKNYYDC